MAAETSQRKSGPRIVMCPTCKGDSVFDPTNPFRPFCSSRCKDIDLGAWADEGFRVPAAPDPEDPSGDDFRLQ